MTLVLQLLLNSIWQSLAVLATALVVLAIARKSSATTRYAVWTSALVFSVFLPLVTTVIHPSQRSSITQAPPIASAARATSHLAIRKPVTQTLAREDETPRGGDRIAPVRWSVLPGIALAIVLLWAAAALVFLIRFLLAIVTLESLKRNATPLPLEYRRRLYRWQSMTESASRAVRLCISDEIRVPVAVGMFDSMILLPSALIEDLDPEDIDRIILHEYAHLRRGDDWINAFQRIALVLFFFNPAIRYIARQMDIEREVSCDDAVVHDAQEAVPLASCLVKMVERVEWPYQALAAPGVFDTRRDLSLRVERLLLFTRDRRTRVALVPTIVSVVAMGTFIGLGSLVAPVFVSAQTAIPESARRPRAVIVAQPIHMQHMHVQQRPNMQRSANPALAGSAHVATAAGARPVVPAHTTPMPPLLMPKRIPKGLVPKIAGPAFTGTHIAPQEWPSDKKVLANSDYLDDLQRAGYTGLSVDEVVELRNMGVDGAYIRSIEAAGFAHPSVRELTQLRACNVTPQFIGQMKVHFGAMSLRDINELGCVGVSETFINNLISAGYKDLTARDILEAKAMNIDRAYIESANAHGFHNLTLKQLVRLKASGVL